MNATATAATVVQQITGRPVSAQDQISRIDKESAALDEAYRELKHRKELMLGQIATLEHGIQNLDARMKALASRRTLALNFHLQLEQS